MLLLPLAVLLLAAPPGPGAGPPPAAPSAVPDSARPNDNRRAAGRWRGDTLVLRLEARLAGWRPDPAVDSLVTVQAFAEAGDGPTIPGPLLRMAAGTPVHLTLRNALADSTLVVHGARAGTVPDDTLQVAPGATREVRFVAGAPGTYHYWGSTTHSAVGARSGRDSQLSGALVIDPPGVTPDPTERIFVMTVVDIVPGDSVRNPRGEDIWDLAINGRSWPHTERFTYAVGDTVRWRWVNASYLPHPMHLHGFHFRVDAKGSGTRDTLRAPGARPLVVTEFMRPGSTFAMTWVPTRAGAWLMHCHMAPHVTPFPVRPDSARGHDAHDVARHPLDAMAGLVLGVTVVERGGAAAPLPPHAPARRLRLLVQQGAARAPAPGDTAPPPVRHGYVLQRDAAPAPDSTPVASPPLVLVRGETVAITVVNRLREPTTVHWHGMELESVYDGVSGWSRTGGSVAPLVAPGDSFVAVLTPPRAGTFLYHTHMDEGEQLRSGLYGPLLVVEPGVTFDPATDLTTMIGTAVVRDSLLWAINGERPPAPRTVRAGTRYRLRFANMLAAPATRVRLLADSTPVRWTPLAKDGADLPPALAGESAARTDWIGPGETYDFAWTPTAPGRLVLEVEIEDVVLRQEVRVLAAEARPPVRDARRARAEAGAAPSSALATPRPASRLTYPRESHGFLFTPAAPGRLTLRPWQQDDALAGTRVPVRVTAP